MNYPNLPARTSRAAFMASALAAAFVGRAEAQNNYPPTALRGMFKAAPKLFLADDGGAGNEVRVSLPGAPPSGATEWSQLGVATPGPLYPDYSIAAIQAGVQAAVANSTIPVPPLQLGSISTGDDIMPDAVNQTDRGVLAVPNEQWWFCSVTLEDNFGGFYGDGATTWSNLNNPARSVVSYYLEGSEGITSALVDEVVVEHLPFEWGIGGPNGDDLVGLDLGGGVVSFDPLNERSAPFITDRAYVFFTFTRDWVMATDPFGIQLSTVDAFQDDVFQTMITSVQDPDAATIYRLVWAPENGVWGWRDLGIALSREELFHDDYDTVGEFLDLEIDALSMDWDPAANGGNGEAQVIFSTTRATVDQGGVVENPFDDELLVYVKDWLGPSAGDTRALPVYVTDLDGQGNAIGEVALSAKMGLREAGAPPQQERNGINGICTGDPEKGIYSAGIGIPRDPVVEIVRPDLNLAVSRGMVLDAAMNPTDTLLFGVSGLAEPGSYQGQAEVVIQVNLVDNIPSSPDSLLPLIPDWITVSVRDHATVETEDWIERPYFDPPVDTALIFRARVLHLPPGATEAEYVATSAITKIVP